jgi:hypothetical protein
LHPEIFLIEMGKDDEDGNSEISPEIKYFETKPKFYVFNFFF